LKRRRDDGRVADDRHRLRDTFDAAADLYQQARPDYPEQLYDTLVETAQIKAGDRLLEVGCATGKATIPLAQRGFRIVCIEIGPDLVTAARRNLIEFPGVEIIQSAFEACAAHVDDQFDLVFAATAWHWIDPATRYQRARELLRPGAHLAFWSATHVVPDDGDRFFFEIQDVYEEIGAALPVAATWPRPGELPDDRGEIEGSGLFQDVVVRHFDWEISYNAEEYIALLDTFSGHIAMQPSNRDRLYAEIRRRLAQRSDGHLRRHWGAVLHVARRADRFRSLLS
jgi:SAM-dependent methyltransferase